MITIAMQIKIEPQLDSYKEEHWMQASYTEQLARGAWFWQGI